MPRLLVLLPLVAAGLLTTAAPPPAAPGPAWAPGVVATSPAQGSVVGEAPVAVQMRFARSVAVFYPALVVGPHGESWSTGDPKVLGRVLSQPVEPLGPAGEYTVHYRARASDGDVMLGSWSFVLSQPGLGGDRPTASDPVDPAQAHSRSSDDHTGRVMGVLVAAGLLATMVGSARCREDAPGDRPGGPLVHSCVLTLPELARPRA